MSGERGKRSYKVHAKSVDDLKEKFSRYHIYKILVDWQKENPAEERVLMVPADALDDAASEIRTAKFGVHPISGDAVYAYEDVRVARLDMPTYPYSVGQLPEIKVVFGVHHQWSWAREATSLAEAREVAWEYTPCDAHRSIDEMRESMEYRKAVKKHLHDLLGEERLSAIQALVERQEVLERAGVEVPKWRGNNADWSEWSDRARVAGAIRTLDEYIDPQRLEMSRGEGFDPMTVVQQRAAKADTSITFYTEVIQELEKQLPRHLRPQRHHWWQRLMS